MASRLVRVLAIALVAAIAIAEPSAARVHLNKAEARGVIVREFPKFAPALMLGDRRATFFHTALSATVTVIEPSEVERFLEAHTTHRQP